jgi:hypothetical protein
VRVLVTREPLWVLVSSVNVGGGIPHELSTADSRKWASWLAWSSVQVKLLVTFLPPRNHFALIAVSVPVTV